MKPNFYDVITAPQLHVIIRRVNDWLEKGWQPCGGIGYDVRDKVFYQAIWKKG